MQKYTKNRMVVGCNRFIFYLCFRQWYLPLTAARPGCADDACVIVVRTIKCRRYVDKHVK